MMTNDYAAPVSIALQDGIAGRAGDSLELLDGGEAFFMGCGTFVLCQMDDVEEREQRVVVTADNMRAMLATLEG